MRRAPEWSAVLEAEVAVVLEAAGVVTVVVTVEVVVVVEAAVEEAVAVLATKAHGY